MDLISREYVISIATSSCLDLDSYDDTDEFCDEVKELPSAFDGMTNGEVIQALFPNSKTETISFNGIRLYIDDEVHTKIADFTYRWWNAPYKAESEVAE